MHVRVVGHSIEKSKAKFKMSSKPCDFMTSPSDESKTSSLTSIYDSKVKGAMECFLVFIYKGRLSYTLKLVRDLTEILKLNQDFRHSICCFAIHQRQSNDRTEDRELFHQQLTAENIVYSRNA